MRSMSLGALRFAFAIKNQKKKLCEKLRFSSSISENDQKIRTVPVPEDRHGFVCQNFPSSRTTAEASSSPAAAGTKGVEPGVSRRAAEPGRVSVVSGVSCSAG